ncbi:hypothetical protein HK102_008816, partial [Quaeritorhiza haematococci]
MKRADLNSASKWLTKPSVADPEFEVVNAGPGSVLVVRLPPSSSLMTKVGTAICASSQVTSELSTEGGALQAGARTLSGGNFFYQKFSAQEKEGTVVIAPRRLGDVAAIEMDGSSQYYVRRSAFLASGPRVSVTTAMKGLGMALNGLFNYKVTGRGTLAITSYGGLYRLVLAPGEEFVVNPKFLVAWDAATHPYSVSPASSPSPSSSSPSSSPSSSSSSSTSITARLGSVDVKSLGTRFAVAAGNAVREGGV